MGAVGQFARRGVGRLARRGVFSIAAPVCVQCGCSRAGAGLACAVGQRRGDGCLSQVVSAGSLFRTPLRTAQTAIWLAPIAILFSRSPVAALVVTLVFTISATELFYSDWAESARALARIPSFRAFGFALALAGQTTIVAVWMGAPLLAAALLCLSAAGSGSPFSCCRLPAQQTVELAEALLKVVVSVILGVGMTVGGRFAGFHSDSQSRLDPDPKTQARPREFITNLYQPSSSARSRKVTDRSFPGVILWPEVKPEQQTLVAPASTSVQSALLRSRARRPIFLSREGPWMFKPPQQAPPRGSYFKRASPLDQSFLTTDQRPLSMEGLQKLNHPLDLGCCRAIQVAIENADRYPDTVALETLLIDSQAPGQPVQSLGNADVLSRPEIKPFNLSPDPGDGNSRFSSASRGPKSGSSTRWRCYFIELSSASIEAPRFRSNILLSCRPNMHGHQNGCFKIAAVREYRLTAERRPRLPAILAPRGMAYPGHWLTACGRRLPGRSAVLQA